MSKGKPRRFSLIRLLGLISAALILSLTIVAVAAAAKLTAGFDQRLTAATAFRPTVTTRVYAAGGELICELMLRDRVMVGIDRVPYHVRNAFIASEDKDFMFHRGIDPMAIIRAALANRQSGRHKQGGSTITQQVIKQVVLEDNEKSYIRKAREALLAVRLERQASKEKILEIYLNQVFLGNNAYGIQAAAKNYFSKDVSQLTLAEAAILAGLPKAPTEYSVSSHYQRAKQRQAYVLGRMVTSGFITAEESAAAAKEELAVVLKDDPLNRTAAPYFCEHVRKELKRMYGNEAIYFRGLTVQTTLDMRMQKAAEAAVRHGLLDLERRLGFTGPEGHDQAFEGVCRQGLKPAPDDTIQVGRVASLASAKNGRKITVCVRGDIFTLDPDDTVRVTAWERRSRTKLTVGDMLPVIIRTREIPAKSGKTAVKVRYALTAARVAGPGHPEALQASIIVVDPTTGALKAMVGGYNYVENQYNAATMSRRQTGSSIKPYVYLTALMRGLTVDEYVNDHPVCYQTASGSWCPTNYENKFMGRVDLRTALAKSLNSVSVQLTAKNGVDEVIRTMRRLGIASPLQRVLPLSVGAAEITLWEHAFAYAAIAAGGKELPRHPDSASAGYFFSRISDSQDKPLYQADPTPLAKRPQAVPAGDAYALTYLMKGVVEFGTGRRVRELSRPAAGKTGTTNDFRDVWFMGFTADLLAGVWVGRMTPQPIAPKATGGSIALPIWLAFMKAAHPETPARDFPVPQDVSLMTGTDGKSLPIQQGRMPRKYLTAH